MLDDYVFLEEFRKLLDRQNWDKNLDPTTLLDWWLSMIATCEEGYFHNIYEYTNDLHVRSRIEVVLTDPRLQHAPRFDNFAAQVAQLDERFRSLLMPGVTIPGGEHWWEQGVLKQAGVEYANDVKTLYNIDIQTLE